MGMYDYLACKYPLPHASDNDLEYQTKDTPAQFLDHYEIRADGSLWHMDYGIEDQSDPNAHGFDRIVGTMSRVNTRWDLWLDHAPETLGLAVVNGAEST